MISLMRRVARLEDYIGKKQRGPQMIYLMPSLEAEEGRGRSRPHKGLAVRNLG